MKPARQVIMEMLSKRSGYTTAKEIHGVISVKYFPAHGYSFGLNTVSWTMGTLKKEGAVETKVRRTKSESVSVKITEAGREKLQTGGWTAGSSMLIERSHASPLFRIFPVIPQRRKPNPVHQQIAQRLAA